MRRQAAAATLNCSLVFAALIEDVAKNTLFSVVESLFVHVFGSTFQ
jgi:hypothetical protein